MSNRYRSLLILSALAVGWCSHEQATANDSFAKASQLYQAGDWLAAADAFAQVAADDQRDVSRRQTAHLYAGECLVQLGRYAEARQRYELVRHQTDSPQLASQALFRLGEVSWLAGDASEAQRLLQRYVETYPDGSSISHAQEYLQQIRQRVSMQDDFAGLDQAVSHERAGRFDAAVAAYAKLLDKPSESPPVRAETLRRAALLHERLAQSQQAISLYRQYLEENPHSKRTAEAMLAIAWNHERLDQTAQALDQFQAVYAKFPQTTQADVAAYWLAQKSAEENHSDQALRYLESLLTQEANKDLRGKAVCLKCQLLSQQDAWPQIETLAANQQERLSEGPAKTRLEFWAAEAAFRQRKYDRARELFRAVQPKTVGIDEAWTAMIPLRRAQLAARRQQWSEVLKILDRMQREHPDFQLDYEIDYLRGRALAGRGEMTAARKFYRRVIENPQATDTEAVSMAGWMIGETFFHQRDYPRARAAYEAVMDSSSYPQWQSRAALQTGKCWELEEHWDEATRVYSTALQRWPKSFSQPQLESRLRWAEKQETEHNVATRQ